jgi:hypothetical protein
MITVITRYFTSNVDSYYEHLTENVMDCANKQYVVDVLPIFSGAQEFNDIATAGGIESCNVTKTAVNVDLKIVWRDSAQWLQFAKDHLDTANGLNTQHKFIRSNYDGDIFYSSDDDAGTTHINEYFDYVCEVQDAKDDSDDTKFYATLPSSHDRYTVPASGW